MRTVFFIPPLSAMSGGLANILALASDLAGMGRRVALTCPGTAVGLPETLAQSGRGLEALPWEGLALTPEDLWVVPESWPNAISPGVNSGARTLIYAQSWNFLLTTLPAGVRWKQLPVRYLAVSRPVAWFMESVLDLRVEGVLPPAVNPVFFEAASKRPKERQRHTGTPVRVAWMPRKNRALAEQIQQVAEAALARASVPARVEWVPVHKVSQAEAADIFASCSLFLCTAFPEGFGLPPLEAMATGCVPVGFTGFGGWEYMRQAATLLSEGGSGTVLPDMQRPNLPEFPLSGKPDSDAPIKAVPDSGNGFYHSDGDVMGAGLSLARAVHLARGGGPMWEGVRESALVTARLYTVEERGRRLRNLWQRLTA